MTMQLLAMPRFGVILFLVTGVHSLFLAPRKPRANPRGLPEAISRINEARATEAKTEQETTQMEAVQPERKEVQVEAVKAVAVEAREQPQVATPKKGLSHAELSRRWHEEAGKLHEGHHKDEDEHEHFADEDEHEHFA